MDNAKDILTTGEVARICNVAPRTVSKWFDTGQLRGYRIPGSKDRRIPRDQLIRFMKLHGMPTNKIDTSSSNVLVVDDDRHLTTLICEHLVTKCDCEVHVAESMFEAGIMAERHCPGTILIDIDLSGFDGRSVTRFFAAYPELSETQLIATGTSIIEPDTQALLQQGFTATLPKPFNIRQLADIVEGSLAVAR